MDKKPLMNKHICWIIALLLCNDLYGAVTKTTLSEAMARKLVTISQATGNGSYNEKGLLLKIENKSNETLLLTVDPALIFRPEDTAYQNLVVAGHEKVTIRPGLSNSIALQTYCGKSYARGPSSANTFRYWKQGDSIMIRVLQYIRNNGIGNEPAQHAVWVLTNHHELGSVYAPEQDEASRKLIAYMAGLLGKELPEYYRKYAINTTPGQPVFSPKTLKIFALFQWQQQIPQSLDLAVYDEQGKLVERLFGNRDFKPGNYEITAKFESAAAAPGAYYIRLTEGSKVLKETKVLVE